MTPHSSVFSKLDPAPHPLNIHIANGSTMHGNGLAFVSMTNLSVPRVFHVPDLSYNLCSMGKLAELGYRLIFYYSRCIVQDPRIGQELRIGPRVRRMFLVDNLHLPLVAPVFFFFCCYSCCSFVLTISPTLAFLSWSCTIFSGTIVSF